MGTSGSGALEKRLRLLARDFGPGIHEPMFMGNEKKYLKECIETGFVSSGGPFVSRFEDNLASYVGSKRAVAVVNGTSALHLALVTVGVKPGDQVLVPALSFVATAAAVVLAGATPHFVDVSTEDWGIDPVSFESYVKSSFNWDGHRLRSNSTGSPVTAVVPMHALGHPCDVEGVKQVADRFGLAIVEDAAEALGSFSHGTHTGLVGELGVFSFNGNKTITTGGGGAIVTNNEKLADRAKHLSTTAKMPHRFEFDHDDCGYNYRMPNINAALGVAQLEQLSGFLDLQRSLHDLYQDALCGLELGSLRSENPGTRSNYWLQAFVLSPDFRAERDEIINACLDHGIPVRPLWRPLNTLAPYRDSPSSPTPVAQDLYERVICLPSSASLAR